MDGRLWQVCGGHEAGGIAVREHAELTSHMWPDRLEVDALVWQLSRRGNRLEFLRLNGSGPDTGWVTVELRGRTLAAPISWDVLSPLFFLDAGVDASAIRRVLQFEQDVGARCYLARLAEHLERGLVVWSEVGALRKSPAQEADAGDWARLGELLRDQSGGRYDPAVMAKSLRRHRESGRPASGKGLSRPYRVSVVAPTVDSRKKFHWFLWACFMAQTWPDKELIVVETYKSEPSSILVEKARQHENVIYVGLPHELSIGLKRNIGLHIASGEVVANFDDDDLYAPNYLESMLEHLEGQDAVAVTLSTWYDFDEKQAKCGFVDPIALGSADPSEFSEGLRRSEQPSVAPEERAVPSGADDTLFGYGFSYVHVLAPALCRPYPDAYLGEDVAFITGLQKRLGQPCVRLLRDELGICLHVMHGGNTADSALHRDTLPEEVMSLAVWDLTFAAPLREAWEASFSISHLAGQFKH